MRSTLLALALTAITASAAAAQAAALPVAQDPRGVASRLDEHMRRLVPFGYSGSLLVAKDGEVVLANGYGLADREAGVPVTAETVFDIGSITKQFTAAAILRLEMEGRLSVSDPVSRWFDGVPADKQGMTLHHLLTHSSGLRDNFGRDYAVAERDSLAGVILGSELLWAPGTRYRYSNAGYSLLGMIVEKASGMGYEPYLREKLWGPAGMTRTGYRVDWRPGELAVGYARGGQRDGTPVDQAWAPDGPWWNLRANGGVLSSVRDLFRWHQALEGEAILSAAAKAKMWTPHVAENDEGSSHYGYGWAIMQTQRGTRLIAHNGGNGIFFADFRRYVDEGVVVLVMSNTADMSAGGTLASVSRAVFGGGELVSPPAAVERDPSRAAAVAGTYALPEGGALAVTADGPRLKLAAQGPAAFALLQGASTSPALEALGARTARIFTAAAGGDYAPLHEGFGGRLPIEQLRQMHGEFMDGLTQRLGAFQGVEPVSAIMRGSEAVLMLEMRFERGRQLVRVSWEDDAIAGIQPARDPSAAVFVPVEGDAWASFDLASGTSMRLRFDGGALVVETANGPVRATRGE
jgi:CubicO group peptidase (beta-lactamase class C family)